MYGTLRGALAGRKIPFDRDGYTATVEGRIVGVGKTIRIKSIHLKYELAVPAESREATERALVLHPQGCPAHQSVQGAIAYATNERPDAITDIKQKHDRKRQLVVAEVADCLLRTSIEDFKICFGEIGKNGLCLFVDHLDVKYN